LDCLAEVAKDGEDKASEIEIFRDVVLAFFDGFVNVSHSFVELILIEVKYGPVVVKGGNVVVR